MCVCVDMGLAIRVRAIVDYSLSRRLTPVLHYTVASVNGINIVSEARKYEQILHGVPFYANIQLLISTFTLARARVCTLENL